MCSPCLWLLKMSNRFLRATFHFLSTKKTALVLLLLFTAHLLFVIHLFFDDSVDNHAVRKNAIIQKIGNVIYLVQATPKKNRVAAIKAIDDPAIKVTLTNKPLSSFQYNKFEYWEIIHALENNLHDYFISVQLNNDQWLNIQATPYTRHILNHLFLLGLEFIIFLAVFATLWSIDRFTAPLKKIKASVEQLGIDLETKPFDVYGPKVVREASEALNQMQNRIMQLVHNRTQLLAAISHDLRTPIARAQLRAQFIEDSDYKTQLLNDLSEMDHMISEALSFARQDTLHEEMKPVDLVSLILSICDDAGDMGNQVAFYTNEHRIGFTGRPIALKRAFTNLINNAIRYAGSATVSIEKRGKKIVVVVEDEGPGIPENEFEKVFEPFYRGEQSRSRDTGGVGLGLAVTRDIILAHHGRIKLDNKKTGGLKVSIHFVAG